MAPTREDIFNLPNLLTWTRIGSIPFLVLCIHQNQADWSLWAGWGFFVIGLTDLLDGFLARRLKQVTVWGKFLDPLADKLLISSVLVVLVELERAPAWAVIIIIAREIGVTGLRAVAESQGFSLPSDMWGKLKNGIQLLAAWLLIFYYPGGPAWLLNWGNYILWLATALTAYSGLAYFLRFHARLKAAISSENNRIDA